MLEFKGRVLMSGHGSGTAVVTRKSVMPTKAFSNSAENRSNKLIFADKQNKDVFKKNLTDKVFVLPSFKASDVNSMVLLSVFKKGIAPKCFLFTEKLDEATISAFIIAKTFLGSPIAVIDSLGKTFLDTVENGDEIVFGDEFVTLNI